MTWFPSWWKRLESADDRLAGRTVVPQGVTIKVTFGESESYFESESESCLNVSIDTYDMQETLYQQEINQSQLTSNKATAGIGNHCLVHRVEMVHLQFII